MTDTQRRPAPYPRVDTERDSALCNADLPGSAAECETPQAGLHSAITHGSRLVGWTRETFTLPKVFAEQAPAAEQVRRYAREAAYAGTSGPMRAGGVAWCYLAAIPTLVVSRLWAWGWERPARFIVVAATVKALSELPPAEWVVDNVIKPGADFALWLFL